MTCPYIMKRSKLIFRLNFLFENKFSFEVEEEGEVTMWEWTKLTGGARNIDTINESRDFKLCLFLLWFTVLAHAKFIGFLRFLILLYRLNRRVLEHIEVCNTDIVYSNFERISRNVSWYFHTRIIQHIAIVDNANFT